MGAPLTFPFDPEEPLGSIRRKIPAPGAYPDLRAFRFEFTSRGDRVPARLLLPPVGAGPFPLVLLQHGTAGAKDAPSVDANAGPWAYGGAAVASIDFPLHGERANAKLSELMLRGLRSPEAPGEGMRTLLGEFLHQAVVDLHRALTALEQLREIDGERVAYVGLGLGSIVGASFCGLEPRVQAAIFAIGDGGTGPPQMDPVRRVGRFAPRPALFIGFGRDAASSREAAEVLFEGGGEPKELLWFEGTVAELPDAAREAMWCFLKRHLGVR